MTLNDYYYQTVAKQHADELRAIAAEDRLAKIARQAKKAKRAEQREARRLQVAVHGRPGLWQALRTLLGPARPAANQEAAATDRTEADRTEADRTEADRTEADLTGQGTAEKPAPTASR